MTSGTIVDFTTVVLVVDDVDPFGVTTTPSSVGDVAEKHEELMTASATSATPRLNVRSIRVLIKESRLRTQTHMPKASWWLLQYL